MNRRTLYATFLNIFSSKEVLRFASDDFPRLGTLLVLPWFVAKLSCLVASGDDACSDDFLVAVLKSPFLLPCC